MKNLAVLAFLLLVGVLAYKYLPGPTPTEVTSHKEVDVPSVKKPRPQTKESPVKRKFKYLRKPQKKKNITQNIPSRIRIIPSDEREYNIQDSEGNVYITKVNIVGENLIGHGDIIVGKTKDLEAIKRGEKKLVIAKPKIWFDNTIPYIVDEGLSNKPNIFEAFSHYMQNTSIRFVERSNEKDYIRFTSGELNCYSSLGRIGGEQKITLHPNCGTGEIIHEIMHALGFLHEQNRNDRDNYVEVIWENIAEENWLQFKKIKNNFFNLTLFPFDFESIMLYANNTFSTSSNDYSMIKTDGGTWDYNNQVLSSGDKNKINSFYPR